MTTELGLRERKKQRSRQLIADTARRLFAERGFEAVPVSEIAREAEVSEATVFNYFPSKEDLFYRRLEAFEEELLSSIRNRPADESVLDAFGRFITTPRGLLAAPRPRTGRAPGRDHPRNRREPSPARPRAADLRQLHRRPRQAAGRRDRREAA